jgi:hypothetical protein
MKRALSIPHEHGGYLTSLGAALAAVGIAPAPLAALGVGVAVVAAFVARGAIDRLAVGKPLARWDRPALALLAALMAGGALLVGWRASPWWGAATAAVCLAMLAGSVTAQLARKQRDALFEALGMGALGASAGLGAFAAGASLAAAATAALALAAHAAIAVPLVRTELRPRERALGGRALVLAALGVLVAAGGLMALGHPLAAAALAPRALHVADRAIRRPAPPRAGIVGLRETLALLVCVGLVVAALR